MRKCSTCKIIKPFSEFPKNKYDKKYGFAWRCRKCSNEYNRQWQKDNKDKVARYYEKWITNNRKSQSNLKRLKNTGCTPEMFENFWKKQNGKCAICYKILKREKHANADHNHITKKVRGLLCPSCNRGLGYLKDNINILENAINYLKENE